MCSEEPVTDTLVTVDMSVGRRFACGVEGFHALHPFLVRLAADCD